MFKVKNWNIEATIQIGYNFQISKRIISAETSWGNTVNVEIPNEPILKPSCTLCGLKSFLKQHSSLWAKMDLNKKCGSKLKTTTAWKETPWRFEITMNWNPLHWVPILQFRITSDAIKIEPKAVVKHYCVWFDFYCIRRYKNRPE